MNSDYNLISRVSFVEQVMSRIFIFFNLLFFVFLLSADARAQRKDRVEAAQKILAEAALKDCKDLKTARILAFPKPDYPPTAKTRRLGGTVLMLVKINEKGSVAEIEKIEGSEILQSAAASAARKAKFTPTICDGAAQPFSVVLTYNFIPVVSTGNYFAPEKIQDLIDVKSDSPYYEAVLNLTENYRLAFGYADKKFYADAPLTRGDFAQFLRLTLDLLAARAQSAGKIPRQINLFNSYNPQKFTAVASIVDLKKTEPFYDSTKILLLTYDIALTNDRNELQGSLPLTNNEVIDVWAKVFGDEAMPVNFGKIADADRLISRGEFALFLQESLQVLTYKVLP